MTRNDIFKAPIFLVFTALLMRSAISGCKPPQAETPKAVPTTSQNASQLAPFRKALACLPTDAAMIAAHRGTDERWRDVAENSIGGLKALINHGTLIAEIDIAGLKDDTLITFHDGVWDDISTGKGPISASHKSDLEDILLRSRKGGLTAERPPLFEDMLRAAKGKIYLEIDFKSSADYNDVIAAIRKADMSDQVMLIAYSAGQAAKLKRLAPEMLRSNPPEAAENDHAVWLGYGVANGTTAAKLQESGHFTIGRIGDPTRQPPLRALRRAADILVTDEAERHKAILGLKGQAKTDYEACLEKN